MTYVVPAAAVGEEYDSSFERRRQAVACALWEGAAPLHGRRPRHAAAGTVISYLLPAGIANDTL